MLGGRPILGALRGRGVGEEEQSRGCRFLRLPPQFHGVLPCQPHFLGQPRNFGCLLGKLRKVARSLLRVVLRIAGCVGAVEIRVGALLLAESPCFLRSRRIGRTEENPLDPLETSGFPSRFLVEPP